jgi:RNase H-like domain found in reverse transcriptase/Integrase zinc binding domain/Integrase core domain
LKEAGLKAKISKCQFAQTSVTFLGHIISADGVRPNPEKVKSIVDFPSPKNADEIKVVLGMFGYYRKYIKNYGDVAHPMVKLLKKGIEFKWTSEQEESFQKLKQRLLEPPILGYPCFTLPFVVYTDASSFGAGAVLCQHQDPDRPENETVIAYTSRHLNDREAKWSTVEKEAFAIVHAVTVFYPYLWGRKFTVITDHNPLKWLMKMSKPTGRLMRWSLLLQEYDMDIQYRSGSKHGNADGLSRIPLPMGGTPLESSEEDPYVHISFIIAEWLEAQEKDSYCKRAKESMNEPEAESGLAMRLNDEKVIILDNGILAYNNGKIIVPEAMRDAVIKRFHENRLSGHLGLPKTLFRIKQRFTWPKMNGQIKEAIENCLLCARRKAHGTRKMPLQPMPVGNYLFERVAMDLVGPVPESRKGNVYILVCGEYVSRYIEAIPLKDQQASTVAHAFLQNIILRHGLPSEIITDQGANFQSQMMKDIYQELGIKQLRTAAYTPRTNGMVEKANRVLVDMLTMYANENPESWDEHLPYAVFAYNTSLNATTKEVPFFVVFGRDPIEPSDLKPPNRYRLGDDVWDDFNWNWHRAIEVSKENLKKQQEYQKTRYDATARPISFEVGDSVLLKAGRSQVGKFYFRYDGPYFVTKKISMKNYVIKHVGTSHEFVVNADRLKKFGTKKQLDQSKEPIEEKEEKGNETVQEVEKESEQCQPKTGTRPRRV